MDEKILIIENERADFYKVKEALYNFSLIPAEYDQYPVPLFENYKNITDFVTAAIKENHKSIKSIIIDISLSSESDDTGIKLIEFIRENVNIDVLNEEDWRKSIPIFCFTNHGDDIILKKAAYERKVTNYFAKESLRGTDGELLLLKQNLLIHKRDFNKIMNYEYNDLHVATQVLVETTENLKPLLTFITPEFTENISRSLNNLTNVLEESSDLIISKIDNVEIQLKGNQEEIRQNFKLIFNTIFKGLSSDKQKKFLNEYENDIVDLISQEKFQELAQTSKWKELKKAFSEVNTEGGFSAFADCIIDLSSEAGISESIPGGKLIGIALKGIIGLISKM